MGDKIFVLLLFWLLGNTTEVIYLTTNKYHLGEKDIEKVENFKPKYCYLVNLVPFIISS